MKDNRLLEMRVFCAVAQTGGFTAAAHLLGTSQPFVSETVTALERRLGVRLLHRSTRTQRLTLEGEGFLVSCRRLIDEVDAAEAALRTREPAGELRVTAPRAFGTDQLLPLLPAFLAAHPRIALRLSLSDATANLLEDHFDVAVRMGRLPPSSLMSRPLCRLQRVVVAAPSYLAAHVEPGLPQDLATHECLLWDGPLDHLNRWPFVVDGRPLDLPVQGRLRSNDGTVLYRMCLEGLGVMRLAEHLALPAIRRGALVPLLVPFQASDDTAIHAVFLPEREPVPRVRAFVDHLRAVFATPPWTVG